MSETDIKIPDNLIEQIDDCYEERGFNSRRDFVIKAVRDAINVNDPFTEKARKEIRKAKEDNEESISFEEIVEKSDLYYEDGG